MLTGGAEVKLPKFITTEPCEHEWSPLRSSRLYHGSISSLLTCEHNFPLVLQVFLKFTILMLF